MSKVALKRFSHPRPLEDFRVDSFSLVLDIQRRHEEAGFPAIPIEVIKRRYWQYISFLQHHGFISRVLARDLADISETSELRNSHLTDEGFRFVQYSHDKWLDRTSKDQGEAKEAAALQRWFEQFKALRSSLTEP
jgi:hypothetical protein